MSQKNIRFCGCRLIFLKLNNTRQIPCETCHLLFFCLIQVFQGIANVLVIKIKSFVLNLFATYTLTHKK